MTAVAADGLLALYADPDRAAALRPRQWSTVLGSARRARAIGHLAMRLDDAGATARVPAEVQAHFESASKVVRRQRQRLRWEMVELADAVASLDVTMVLLKGAAYEAMGLRLAGARLAGDVDVLVPTARLADVERRLTERGWSSVELDAHDERYYREWSHEVPPLAHPQRGIEVDVHHSISPTLRGDAPVVRALMDASRPVSWLPREGAAPVRAFRVLQPIDQLVHVAVHTFGDSDLALRLREAMDFDLLFRAWCTGPSPEVAPAALVERAASFGQARPMWWALHLVRRWLGTPVDPALLDGPGRPSAATIAAMTWFADRAMLPGATLRRGRVEFLAEIGLLGRYQWQRLPLRLLVPHLAEKVRRRVVAREPGRG